VSVGVIASFSCDATQYCNLVSMLGQPDQMAVSQTISFGWAVAMKETMCAWQLCHRVCVQLWHDRYALDVPLPLVHVMRYLSSVCTTVKLSLLYSLRFDAPVTTASVG